jgi:hypothetical protein
LGLFFLSRRNVQPWHAASGGAALALALMMRPTSALVLVAFGGLLLLRDRKLALYYGLGALPFVAFLAHYNWQHFGNPLSFGQLETGKLVASAKTGSSDLWQTPLWLGTAGLLFSPSRGLLTHTPIAIVGLWGLVKALTARVPTSADAPTLERDAFFRATALAFVGLFVMGAKWFDWWGGWSFGYRQIVDTIPLLAILSVAGLPSFRGGLWRGVLGLACAWSIYVQVLGSFAYSVATWNALDGRDIDQPQFRQRLWSVEDSQLRYLATHFVEARDQKEAELVRWLQYPQY